MTEGNAIANNKNRVDEAFRARCLEQIRQFRLLDDDFFRACFQDDIAGAEFILRILMGKEDLRVLQTKSQHHIKNLKGHSVILDVFAEDSEGKRYDIEVQRDDSGAVPKRARYNSSLMDAQLLSAAEDYGLLPHSYVIFITENDVLKKGLPIYHIERMITETGDYFGDDSHIIYVNGGYTDDSALGKLMHDFHCMDPEQMVYPFLQEKTRYLKQDTKGVTHMCKIMEEIKAEGYAEGLEDAKEQIAEAKEQAAEAIKRAAEIEAKAEAKAKAEAEAKAEAKKNAIKNAISMLQDGLPMEKVSRYSGLSLSEVQEFAALTAH